MTQMLLLNPPVATPCGPSLAIPALVAYLRSRGVSVEVCDVNLGFFRHLLTASRILEGLRYAQERFFQLNSSVGLTFLQMLEYHHLLSLLNGLEQCQHELELMKTGLADFEDFQEFGQAVKNLFVQVASSPHAPEVLMYSPELHYESPLSPFSSEDLLSATRSRTMFSDAMADALPSVLERHRPQIVGISVSFSSQLLPGFWLARLVKQLAPGAHVTMGGSAVSIFLRSIEDPKLLEHVDSLILDEGELPLELLCRELNSAVCELGKVPGIRYLHGGRIVTTEGAPPVDLEALPVPAYETLPLDDYVSPRRAMQLPLRLSRGCPWRRCTFCRTNLPMESHHQQVRPEHAYEQLKEVLARTGVRRVHFSDESADAGSLEFIARRLLEERRQVEWIAHMRVSPSLTAAQCRLFRESGCRGLMLGVESLNDRVLRLMNKGLTAGLVDTIVRELGPHIALGLYMMVGFPTETREEALSGHALVKAYLDGGLIQKVTYSLFTVAFGSDVWMHPERYGVRMGSGPGRADLNPDVGSFECDTGLTRAEAAALYGEFVGHALLEARADPEAMTIGGKTVELAYSLSRLRRTVLTESAGAVFRPLAEMLRAVGDDGVKLRPGA